MRGSGCFISAWVRVSGRTVVVVVVVEVETLGQLQTASLQTLTNGLCETTAIDIYLISPHPSTVTTLRLAIILWGFWAQVWVMPWGHPPPHPLHTSFLLPWGGPEKERQRRGWNRWRGEKVKVKKLQAWWRNIHVSLFSLVYPMKYDSDYKAEERKDTFWGYIFSCDGNKLQP